VGTYVNWSGATVFADGEYVSFLDGTSYPSVVVGSLVAPSLMVVSNSSTAYTFTSSGGISTPLLVKDGDGTVSLQNSGNSFGAIALRAGTLSYDLGTTETAKIVGGGTLRVGGTGNTLILNNNMSGFDGPIVVTSGNTLTLGANNVLGTTNGATTIDNGATLNVNGKTNQTEEIIVSGVGAGSGAIVNTGAAQTFALGRVTLVGDTTFGGTARWDIRSMSGSTNNSVLDVPVACTLTKVGVGTVGLVNTTVGAALGDINVQEGIFQLEGTTSPTVGNPNNTINLAFGTTLGLNTAAAVPVPGWSKKIVLGGDATISKAGNGSAPLVGTVDLGYNTLKVSCTSGSLNFSNVISGGGNILNIGASPVSLLGANTYSGTTTVSNGSLTLSTASTGSSGYTVYANTTLGARRHAAGGSLNMPALTLGNSGAGVVTLVFDLATYGGHPTAPVMNVSSGTLTTNAATYNVTVLADLNGLTTGTFPLLKYPGNTFTNAIVALPLPAGVVGTITNNTGTSQVELTITSVARTLDWVGNVSSAWNISTTANWVETGTTNPTVYKELGIGDNVRFTDTASNYTVNVAATVSPATMLVSGTNNYTIGGAPIAGSVQVQVQVGASNTVTLTGNNTYTGGTFFDNGTTIVSSDANLGGYTVGGTNGVMRWSGGAVRYTASATNTRPLIVENSGQNCVIIVDTNQTVQLGGTLNMPSPSTEELRKSGPGSLVLTNRGLMRLWVEEGMTTVAGNAAVTNLGNGGQSISSTNGIARLVFKDSASLLVTDSTFSIGDGASQTNSIIAGELTVQDNAVLALYSLDVGKFLNATGRVYQTGGTVTTNSVAQSNWRIGGGAIADTNAFGGYYLSGGTLNIPGRSLEAGRFGTGELVVSGVGTMQAATLNVGQSYPASGLLVVNGGAASVTLSGNLSVPVLGKTGTAVITNGGTLTAAALVLGNTSTNATSGSVTVGSGGTLKVGRVSGSATAKSITFDGGTLKANASSTTYMEGLTSATIASGGLTVDTDTNSITINQNMTGAGGLTKTGSGTLNLGSQSYTGTTIISQGSLIGTPTLAGGLEVRAGATVSPGISTGTVIASGNVSLAGTAIMEISKNVVVLANDQIASGGTITNGGTVIVTNLGPTALAAGTSFTLFNSTGHVGSFASVQLPAVDAANGNNLTWANTLATDGKITLLTSTPPVTTPSPTNITYSVSSGQLVLNWPNGQGWLLQGQANPLSVGLHTNWTSVSTNSPYTNLFVAPTVFYRLIYTNAP
jgi:autotransporter-associated beta strand protein